MAVLMQLFIFIIQPLGGFLPIVGHCRSLCSSFHSFIHVAGGSNSSRSIRNMILDSIWDAENYGKGWLGYDIMPRAPTAVFVELLITASLVLALVLTPLTKKVVQKLWQQHEVTWHAPMFLGRTHFAALTGVGFYTVQILHPALPRASLAAPRSSSQWTICMVG